MKKYQLLYLLLLLYLMILCFQKLCKISFIVSTIEILWAILCSFFVTFLLYPFIKKLPPKWKWKYKVFMVYGILLIGIISCISLFIPLFIQQGKEVMEQYPKLFEPYMEMFSLESLQENINLTSFSVSNIQPYFSSVSNMIQKCTDYLFVYLLSLFISLDLSFFYPLFGYLKRKMNLLFIVYERFSIMIFQYIKATFLDLLILGVGAYLILWLFHIEGALLYAILLAVGNLIPYIGSMIALVMIALIVFLNYGFSIWPVLLCLWGFQQLEANFIQNLLFHKVMHVRSLFTFLAFYITQALMGFWWILLSPILAGFLEMIVQAFIEVLSGSDKMHLKE